MADNKTTKLGSVREVSKKKKKQSGRKPGPYTAMRLVKQGELPDGRTFAGKALKLFEDAVIAHFGKLNPAQQIVLSGLMPLVAFLHEHPMITASREIAADWKWAWHKVFDAGMVRLASLATPEAKDKPLDLDSLMVSVEGKEND